MDPHTIEKGEQMELVNFMVNVERVLIKQSTEKKLGSLTK
jgi:hypothetical protein